MGLEVWYVAAGNCGFKKTMMRKLVEFIARIIMSFAYAAQKEEGLNLMFQFIPSRLIAPTLRKHGALIGKNVDIHTPIQFHNVSTVKGRHYENLKIGDNSYLGRDVFIDLADQVTLEANVTVSMKVILITHTHVGKSALGVEKLKPSYAPIVLRESCYVGANATILQGVELGRNVIVGAGAVVISSVEENDVVVGVPAKTTYHRISKNDHD
jgi:acetyltransferase-like isoleucine patch superfamily enzyme